MSRNKKSVVYVAIALGALILLPILLILVSKLGGGGPSRPPSAGASTVGSASVANYDLRQLAEKAESLLNDDLAEAIRDGDVSLDFVMDLKRDFDKAESALASGKSKKAAELYGEVIQTAELTLAGVTLAESARQLKDSTYAQLNELDHLQGVFKESYAEAVDHYNQGQNQFNEGNWKESVAAFEMTGALLGDLEARSLQQVQTLIEQAEAALNHYELDEAREAYEAVQSIEPNNTAASQGLAMVKALDGIASEVKALERLEEDGELDKALAMAEELLVANPGNAFLENKQAGLQEQVILRDFDALVAEAGKAEGEGDYEAAIKALESALTLKPDAQQATRLASLKEKYKAARLETLLSTGFNALKAARFEEARDIYKEAVALAPESKEARTGYEKASSLYLANIRYTQNLETSDKYLGEGRYPLAAKFFNNAMAARPSTVTSKQKADEDRIRTVLGQEGKQVELSIVSDKRTFVSMIGVFPPEKMKSKELTLFPDVYKYRGTRKGYQTVEGEIRIDSKKAGQEIEIICTVKQ